MNEKSSSLKMFDLQLSIVKFLTKYCDTLLSKGRNPLLRKIIRVTFTPNGRFDNSYVSKLTAVRCCWKRKLGARS